MDNWFALSLSSFAAGYIARLWRERKPGRKKKSKFIDLLIGISIVFLFYMMGEGK